MLPRILYYIGFVLLFVLAAAPSPNAESGSSWLERLNFYRATASLPPVEEEPRLSGAIFQHARYMVMHDVVKHSQNPRHSWATMEGARAAALSNLAASTSPAEPDAWAIDVWMQAPFHALGILDPALRQVGFGIYREPNGKIQTGAGLDVIRGRHSSPASVSYPIVWPAHGASVPIVAHVGEYPSPLRSCKGYEAPTGLPLIVQLGSGEELPHVTGSWIVEVMSRAGGSERSLEHCVFDEGTYRNRNAGEQRLGRSILASRDAIVLIPRVPLRSGFSYRAMLEVNGRLIDWTFNVSRARL